VIDDFGELIFREIDYRAEMVNCQRFAELYANIPGVYVPKIYNQLTRRRVLTMEWVEGDKLVDKAQLEARGLDASAMVDTLVQCTLRQLLEKGLFHADPHGERRWRMWWCGALARHVLVCVSQQGTPCCACHPQPPSATATCVHTSCIIMYTGCCLMC
jgi:ABC1 atypical kinase-like domain